MCQLLGWVSFSFLSKYILIFQATQTWRLEYQKFRHHQWGIFISENPSEGTLRNEETGKIEGGKFNTSVRNFGTIDDGIFNFSVSNYGTVNNGTFTDRYSNASVSKTNPDNTVTKNYGFTNGGIFSRYASFDNQPDIKLSWVTLNNCTANGISGLVGVVATRP